MNRFILEDKDIIILGEKEAEDVASNALDNNSPHGGNNSDRGGTETSKSLNGGPGSGNFGHAGRPGKVGGSAPTGSSSPEVITIIAEGVEKSMDFDTILKRRDLQQRLKKIRKIGNFNDEIIEEMRKLHFSEQEIEWWRAAILAKDITHIMGRNVRRERQARIKDSPEQKEAIENVISKVSMLGKDATWLRNNCDVEMARAFSREVDRAKEEGIENISLTLNDSKSINGRMGYNASSDVHNLTIRKGLLRETKETKESRERQGPNGKRFKTSEDIGGTFVHEFGHALEVEFAKSLVGNRVIAKKSMVMNEVKRYTSGAIIQQAMRNVEKKGITKDELFRDTSNKYMSAYGKTNNSEAIAESHANPNFSQFTKEINDIVTGKSKIDKDLLDPIMRRINVREKAYQEYHS